MDSESYAFTDHCDHPPHTSLVPIIDSLVSEEGVMQDTNEQLAEDSSQLHQQVTIGTLPDDILLKIFKIFVNEVDFVDIPSNDWRTLVHICRRWRNVAFTSPRHLNLQLLCKYPFQSVKKMLDMDIWPELPMYLQGFDCQTKEGRDDITAALRLNHRMSAIRLEDISDLAWESFVSLMQHPFPAQTYLWIWPSVPIKSAISRYFLGGSAPGLRGLVLFDIPFPALPELLVSATNLVRLWYQNIPRSGYVSPQEMVTVLSALTRLESLTLSFQSRDLPDRKIQIAPPHTPILLPLTFLVFWGSPEYIEGLVAPIHAPLLETMMITLFHQEVLEVSELAKFVRRADKLSSVDKAIFTITPADISVLLSEEFLGRTDPQTLILTPECHEQDFRLSNLAQFCASCLPTLTPFERLYIPAPVQSTWQDVIDEVDPQWLKLLSVFHAVKDLCLSKPIASRVAQALRRIPVEQVSDVLPNLEDIFISGLEPVGPVKEAISEFADARRLAGYPVSIYDWEGRVIL